MYPRVLINGRLLPRREARVSVEDGGFLHGEGVFETLRLYDGNALFLGEHLDRLSRGAAVLGLACPPPGTFHRELIRLVEANRARGDLVCRISLSRGPGPRPAGRPAANPATRVMLLRPLPEDAARGFERGVHARTLPFERAAGPLAALKTLSYLPSLLALRAAELAGSTEAIFVSPDASVLEGSTTNLFALAGDVLVTPPADGRIVPGVMRGHLLTLAGRVVPPIKEAPLDQGALGRAREIFLTNAVREILPVIRLDGRPVGGGRPGPLTRGLQAAWRAHVSALLAPAPTPAPGGRRRAQK